MNKKKTISLVTWAFVQCFFFVSFLINIFSFAFLFIYLFFASLPSTEWFDCLLIQVSEWNSGLQIHKNAIVSVHKLWMTIKDDCILMNVQRNLAVFNIFRPSFRFNLINTIWHWKKNELMFFVVIFLLFFALNVRREYKHFLSKIVLLKELRLKCLTESSIDFCFVFFLSWFLLWVRIV